MKTAFLCHTSTDWEFVSRVAVHLRRNEFEVYCFEEHTDLKSPFPADIGKAINASDLFVFFVGARSADSKWQEIEAGAALARLGDRQAASIVIVQLFDHTGRTYPLPGYLGAASALPRLSLEHTAATPHRDRFIHNHADFTCWAACEIVTGAHLVWRSVDDLPVNPHLFDYEKDIIQFYMDAARLGNRIFQDPAELAGEERECERQRRAEMRQRLMEGCPPDWPQVQRCEVGQPDTDNPLEKTEVGQWRPTERRVVAAALSVYHRACDQEEWNASGCMLRRGFSFCEAGPRQFLHFPRGGRLKVAILASGGIAPGSNAVIDGIVQRHWTYAHGKSNSLEIYGFKNGFRAFDALNTAAIPLAIFQAYGPAASVIPPDEAALHANDGGCVLGTSRADELIHGDERLTKLQAIARQLDDWNIDILYVIGGDGSMKAAHALWSVARDMRLTGVLRHELSVIAVPKTMDNDILWMWQSFGFLSAVEKARDCIENLHTEVSSNPRLCVMQLFGSDSGFIVSHAALATATGQCDVALIPEVPFSMRRLALHLKLRMRERGGPIPHGLVVMAETAIPTDALDYVDHPDIGLSKWEREEIRRFSKMRDHRSRIEGQTSDLLRSAGLKIVSKGLEILLKGPLDEKDYVPPGWDRLRVVTSEPRHLLRSTRPSCSDILMGQRLGTLAVDNAMAGYTDFMISQWLTEYVLVPLKLVVLGRKRIPSSGIFWKSVLAKTRQPTDMT